MTVLGIGPVISSAMAAAIGAGDAFSKGRDVGAGLGLVPKQLSTGDRTILGSISKRGNRYLRSLFVQAAWVVLVKIGPKWRLRSPTNSPASPGRFFTRGAATRASRPKKPRPDPLNLRAVLGTVKAWPGHAGARGKTSATANLEAPSAIVAGKAVRLCYGCRRTARKR